MLGIDSIASDIPEVFHPGRAGIPTQEFGDKLAELDKTTAGAIFGPGLGAHFGGVQTVGSGII